MTISEGDAINSIGDTDISVKYGLTEDQPVVISGTLTLGLPLGNDSGGRDGSLQTGDGEFNQMIAGCKQKLSDRTVLSLPVVKCRLQQPHQWLFR